MHLNPQLISYGKQVIRTPQQSDEFRKLYSEYRKLKSPFKKAKNLENQIIAWNRLKWDQKTSEAGFYCGWQTGLIADRIDKLPVFKQLKTIGKFFSNLSDKVDGFRMKHNF